LRRLPHSLKTLVCDAVPVWKPRFQREAQILSDFRRLTDGRYALRLRLMAPFVPWVPKQNMDSDTLWQGYPVNPLKGTLQLLALQRQVAPRLGEVRQPTLIVQGRLDTTVHASVPDQIASGVRAQIVEKHWMAQSAHCVLLDRELDQVTGLTLKFLARVLGPDQSIERPATTDSTTS